MDNKQKEKIIFFGVSLTMFLVFVIWITTLQFPQTKSIKENFDFATYKEQLSSAIAEAGDKLTAIETKPASSTAPTADEIQARVDALTKDLESRTNSTTATSTEIIATTTASTTAEIELANLKQRLEDIEIKLNDKQ